MAGIRSLLKCPLLYGGFRKLISSEAGQKTYVKEHLRPEQGMRILDIGCGPAGILDYLPEVDYVGFDLSQSYID